VTARDLVVPVNTDHEAAFPLQSSGEQRKHVRDRRFVRPLQVVEHDRHRLAARDGLERAAHSLEQGCVVSGRRRRAELRQK